MWKPVISCWSLAVFEIKPLFVVLKHTRGISCFKTHSLFRCWNSRNEKLDVKHRRCLRCGKLKARLKCGRRGLNVKPTEKVRVSTPSSLPYLPCIFSGWQLGLERRYFYLMHFKLSPLPYTFTASAFIIYKFRKLCSTLIWWLKF